MQPELPWNVAGIPPEAREAARAAARREGLSVGEWLTRQILKTLTEAEAGGWARSTGDYDLGRVELGARPGESQFERAAAIEPDPSETYRKLEEQLRGLTRRFDATEHAQSENSRAVSKAAAEINIASREQAEAFEQLGQHVATLGDRLSRLERSTVADGVKDAVKGLHSGLSRLADQIADTNNQSATQFAALTRNVETVASKLNDARAETSGAQRAIQSKLHDVDDRLRTAEGAHQATADKLEKAIAETEKLIDFRAEANATQRALSAKFQTVEDRLRASETVAQTTSEKVDKVLVDIETVHNAQRADQSESQRQGQLVTQLSDALDTLTGRLSTSEARTAGTLTRLEDQIGAIEARRNEAPMDRRLRTIERAFTELTERVDAAERETETASPAAEENLRANSARLDDMQPRAGEIAASFAPQIVPPPPVVAPLLPQAPAAHEALAVREEFVAQHQTPFVLDIPAAPHAPESTEPAASVEPQVTPQSFIASARRSAGASAGSESLAGLGFGRFGQTPVRVEETKRTGRGRRILLIAGLGLAAIAAVAVGDILSHNLVPSSSEFLPMPLFHNAVPRHRSGTVRTAQLPPTAAATRKTPSIAAAKPVTPVAPVAPATKVAAAPTTPPKIAATLPAKPAAPAVASAAQKPPPSDLERLTLLASGGDSKAELLLGLEYLDGNGVTVNEAEAAKWLERAAGKGEAIAAYRLGTLYERGHGVPANPTEATQWYLAAAKLGNRKAMHNLAVSYAEGSGTPRDLTQAAQWFSRAAALGLGDSEFNLAVLYERGMGVHQSLIDAYKWYAIAAAQGDAESRARLDLIASQLNSDERAAAQKAASEFRPQPLDRNANVPPDSSIVGQSRGG